MKKSARRFWTTIAVILGFVIVLLVLMKGNGAPIRNMLGPEFIGTKNQKVLIGPDGEIIKDEPKNKEEEKKSPPPNYTGRRRGSSRTIFIYPPTTTSSETSYDLEKSKNYTDEKVGEVKEELGEFKVETNGNFKKTNDNIDDVKDMLRKKEETSKYRDKEDNFDDDQSSPRMFE